MYRCSLFSSFNVKIKKIKAKKVKKTVEYEDNYDPGKENSDFDFNGLVDEIIDDEKRSPLPRDLKIDDRDMPQAKNCVEWILDKRFLSMSQSPFGKQLQIATNTFGEWCPRCSKKKFIADVPVDATPDDFLEKVQMLEWGICPKCKATKSELYASGELKLPTQLVGMAGQRGSKSTTLCMMLSYHSHTYLKLQNAPKVFGLLDSTTLHGQLTALTYQGAKDLLWDPLLAFLLDSKWYQDYHILLTDIGNKYGEELFKLKDTFYSNRARKLFLYPTGPDRKKMRGRTGYCSAVDEIGLMDSEDGSNKVKMNSDEVYTSLNNSMYTIRQAYFKQLKKGNNMIVQPLLGCISSPMNKKDKIVRLYEQSKSNKDMYGFHLATWQMNPNFTYEDIMEKEGGDMMRIMRDFGAVPPNSSLPYIEKIESYKPSINRNLRNGLSVYSVERKTTKNISNMSAKVQFRHPKDQNKRLMAVDAGQVNNSFSMVTGFFDTITNKPVFDNFIEIIPRENCPINFNFIYTDVFLPVIDYFNIQMVVADRWQGIKLLNDLEEECGVDTETYSVKYSDFSSFKQDIFTGAIELPRPELKPEDIERIGEKEYPNGFIGKPISHLLYQGLTVEDHGKAVLKGDGTTDDLLRALVLCYSYVVDPDYKHLCMGMVNNGPQAARALGTVGSFGGGGGKSGGAMSGAGTIIGTVGGRSSANGRK